MKFLQDKQSGALRKYFIRHLKSQFQSYQTMAQS